MEHKFLSFATKLNVLMCEQNDATDKKTSTKKVFDYLLQNQEVLDHKIFDDLKYSWIMKAYNLYKNAEDEEFKTYLEHVITNM